MAFEEFQIDRIKDQQADIPEPLYKCTDGEMRTAYGRSQFEKCVHWTWLGWIYRDPGQPTRNP